MSGQPGNVVCDDTARTVTTYDAFGAVVSTRPYTPAENAAADASAAAAVATTNTADLVAKARAAQASNATFLALTSPTQAQTLTQVQRLTRQANALIKLAINDLQATDGT